MKNVKLMLLAVTAMLFLGIENVNAQETVYIEVWETTTNKKDSKIIVISGDDTIETIPIDPFKFLIKENETTNGVYVKKEIDKWVKKNFEIKSSFTRTIINAAGIGTGSVTTIILSKDE